MNRKIDFSLIRKLNSISNIDFISFLHMSNNSVGLSISHFTLNNMLLKDFLDKVNSITNNYKDFINYNLVIKIINSENNNLELQDNTDVSELDINQIYDYIFESISNNNLNNTIFVLPNYKEADLIEKYLLDKVNVRQYDNSTLKTREIRLAAFYLAMKKEFK